MTHFFTQHKKFMESAGQEIPEKPNISPQLHDFHKGLIDEETKEFNESYQVLKTKFQEGKIDAEELIKLQAYTIKEAGDMIYVLTGFIRSLGVDPEVVMLEIARANLEKVAGKIIKDEVTGKVLKPKEYKKADIIGIIQEAKKSERKVD